MRIVLALVAHAVSASALIQLTIGVAASGRMITSAAHQPLDPSTCPLHGQHMLEPPTSSATPPGDAVQGARGAEAMGFDQTRTSHHFRLTSNGGLIDVHVSNPADSESREQVVVHLQQISRQLADGDFSAAIATHAGEPAGVPVLRRLKRRITYTFEATAAGGRVVIATRDGEARAAVHEFLRYQIREHHTGDRLDVDRRFKIP